MTMKSHGNHSKQTHTHSETTRARDVAERQKNLFAFIFFILVATVVTGAYKENIDGFGWSNILENMYSQN